MKFYSFDVECQRFISLHTHSVLELVGENVKISQNKGYSRLDPCPRIETSHGDLETSDLTNIEYTSLPHIKTQLSSFSPFLTFPPPYQTPTIFLPPSEPQPLNQLEFLMEDLETLDLTNTKRPNVKTQQQCGPHKNNCRGTLIKRKYWGKKQTQ